MLTLYPFKRFRGTYAREQSLFDKRGTKTIPKSSVGELLRALGQNPTQAEVAEIEATLPAEVDLGTFESVLNRPDGYRSAGTAGALICSPFSSGFMKLIKYAAEEFIRGFQCVQTSES